MSSKTAYRFTRQRTLILDELRKTHTHPSADELYEKVRKKLPKISLGTIYRNLETLTALGEIQKIEMGCTQKRFDGNPAHHFHIRCTVCGCIVDAHLLSKPDMETAFQIATDFQISGYRLEFTGVCPVCQRGFAAAPDPETAR